MRIAVPLIISALFLLPSCTKKEAVVTTTLEEFQKNLNDISSDVMKKEILYGKDLIDNTAAYIGPNGSVAKITGNLMSCKNCHLDSGMRPLALTFADSHGLYPQYRSREGKILTLADRINSCIKMPLMGTKLDPGSREMQALLLYIKMLGTGRPALAKDQDDRVVKLEFLDRAASPEKGHPLYLKHCASCHQENGSGVMNEQKNGWIYPPLWGAGSYRNGSSMSRVTMFARFIKTNMPYGIATYTKPVLTDEEAFDIAAFVNSENLNPRPDIPKEIYPDIALKPFDASTGPFADPFPPDQHKYGPFKPILNYRKDSQPHLQKLPDGDLNSP